MPQINLKDDRISSAFNKTTGSFSPEQPLKNQVAGLLMPLQMGVPYPNSPDIKAMKRNKIVSMQTRELEAIDEPKKKKKKRESSK